MIGSFIKYFEEIKYYSLKGYFDKLYSFMRILTVLKLLLGMWFKIVWFDVLQLKIFLLLIG